MVGDSGFPHFLDYFQIDDVPVYSRLHSVFYIPLHTSEFPVVDGEHSFSSRTVSDSNGIERQ